MALTCSNTSRALISVDQGAHTATYSLSGSFTGNDAGDPIFRNFRVNGTLLGYYGGGTQFSDDIYSAYTGNPVVAADTSGQTWNTVVRIGNTGPPTAEAGTLTFKSDAVTASASAPTVTPITYATANVDCSFTPNTSASTCSAQLQYKKTADSTWVSFGSPKVSSGYSADTVGTTLLEALEGSTSYDVRVLLTRTTTNETTLEGTVTTFVTSPAYPTAVTEPATQITAVGAILNATVSPNNQPSINASWRLWNAAYPAIIYTYTYPSNPITESTFVSYPVSGLNFNTTYNFYSRVDYGSRNVRGATLSFTTPGDPVPGSLLEDFMQVFEFNERKYGVASTMYFALGAPSTASADRFYYGAAPFVAGDVQISKDGGAWANVNDLPVRIGTSATMALTLTATEMQATTIVVQIIDQDGPQYRDAMLIVRTKQELGQVVVDASQVGGSASAVTLTPSTGGYGLSGTGSPSFTGALRSGVTQTGSGGNTIVLDSGASGTNDFYNGCLVIITSGTGVGQARVITDYVASTFTATVHKTWLTTPLGAGNGFLIIPGEDLWEVSPGVELASEPTSASSFGKLLQFVWQRFGLTHKMTSVDFTMYKADDTTPLAIFDASDSSGVQSIIKR